MTSLSRKKSPFLRQRPPEWRGPAIALFWTGRRNSSISHSYAGPEPCSRKSTREPGERGSWEKAAHWAEAPLTQAQININRRRASGPWADAHSSCGRVRRGPRWQGWGGQTPPSARARPPQGPSEHPAFSQKLSPKERALRQRAWSGSRVIKCIN